MSRKIFVPTIILLCFVVVVGGALTHGWQDNDKPSSIVRNYYELALQGEIEKALSLWTEGNTHAEPVNGKDVHKEGTQLIYDMKAQIVAIESEKIVGEKAKVIVKVKYSEKFTDKEVYILIKRNGEWKINSHSGVAFEEAFPSI